MFLNLLVLIFLLALLHIHEAESKGPFIHLSLSQEHFEKEPFGASGAAAIRLIRQRAIDLWEAQQQQQQQQQQKQQVAAPDKDKVNANQNEHQQPQNVVVSSSDFVLMYRDIEGDLCYLLSDHDLSCALESFRNHSSQTKKMPSTDLRVLADKKKEEETTVDRAGGDVNLQGIDGPRPVIVRARATVKSAWIKHRTMTYNSLKDFLHIHREPMRGKFGGRLDQPAQEATGFFHVKRIKDRWTFIDPEGHPFICAGLNSVDPRDKDRDYREAFANEFGDKTTWAHRTYDFLFQEIGINTLGCWSDIKTFNENGYYAPYCPRWNLMLGYAGSRARLSNDGVIPVFDPDFETYCDEQAKATAETANDPWLLGHFSDNELPLKSTNILKLYLKLPETDHGHQAALEWLNERNKTQDDITIADNTEFCTLVISRYYRIVSTAIKKYDPNHLFLGSRFHGGVLSQDCTFIACGPWIDVVSCNYYHRWTPEQARINRWSELSGRPILPTEWYAKGDDSGLANDGGAGFSVATQEDRGAFYQNFALGCLRNPNVVGWHWFRHIDSPGTNAGLYDLQFKPWAPLAESMKAINTRLYSLSDYISTASGSFFFDKDETVPE